MEMVKCVGHYCRSWSRTCCSREKEGMEEGRKEGIKEGIKTNGDTFEKRLAWRYGNKKAIMQRYASFLRKEAEGYCISHKEVDPCPPQFY